MSVWAAELGLEHPIVCAPMGGVAGGRLAAAVSRTGALGMIGMGSSGSAVALRRELANFRMYAPAEPVPWGIGMVAWGIERDPEMLDVALSAGPSVISVGFGDWEADPQSTWIDAARSAGAQTVTQVATVSEARYAADAGVDLIVARGMEAGGHGQHFRPRDDLLREVIAAVDVPVLSAGAIHTPAQIDHALAAGAAGVWIGTAFQACTESLVSDAARRVLFAATGEDTMVSRVLDVALERPWPERIPERLLRTPFVERWDGREAELASNAEARAAFREAYAADDFAVVPIDAGEGVGALTEELSAAEVIRRLTGGL
ncbi:NAD(P)H-dependent flavin oxidoreductase [Leucobacter denitrificans]|uniref:Nitronate monooxygenase n=1 Tax=Leucobacter denitrificans TaxID=683042 RepID=A0A7G9S4F6_9MICO|nr:nitronate monooxygenase [Leucobacter denitrificans]QNN62731.1 nitronate monooxygenase [Leucobacter denitrificans]